MTCYLRKKRRRRRRGGNLRSFSLSLCFFFVFHSDSFGINEFIRTRRRRRRRTSSWGVIPRVWLAIHVEKKHKRRYDLYKSANMTTLPPANFFFFSPLVPPWLENNPSDTQNSTAVQKEKQRGMFARYPFSFFFLPSTLTSLLAILGSFFFNFLPPVLWLNFIQFGRDVLGHGLQMRVIKTNRPRIRNIKVLKRISKAVVKSKWHH